MKLAKIALLLLLVILLTGCQPDITAPEKPCVPSGHPDSTMTIPMDSTGAYVITIKWCGPITVK
jgi:hypothetical protein